MLSQKLKMKLNVKEFFSIFRKDKIFLSLKRLKEIVVKISNKNEEIDESCFCVDIKSIEKSKNYCFSDLDFYYIKFKNC